VAADLIVRVRPSSATKGDRSARSVSAAAQRALNLAVMKLLGFDFSAGRLDESTHPFSGGVPEDVRLTTRYREDDFKQSLMGSIHETGHARFEQNLPANGWASRSALRVRRHSREPKPGFRNAARAQPRLHRRAGADAERISVINQHSRRTIFTAC
jgi:hypothetical protein